MKVVYYQAFGLPVSPRAGGHFPAPLSSDPQDEERPGTVEGVRTHVRIRFVVLVDVLVDLNSHQDRPTKNRDGCRDRLLRHITERIRRPRTQGNRSG